VDLLTIGTERAACHCSHECGTGGTGEAEGEGEGQGEEEDRSGEVAVETAGLLGEQSDVELVGSTICFWRGGVSV